MSDQADGLRRWVRKSRASSVARDSGDGRRRPREPFQGRNGEAAVLDAWATPVQAPAIVESGSPDADRPGERLFEEVVLM
jgi:hypothetical protein